MIFLPKYVQFNVQKLSGLSEKTSFNPPFLLIIQKFQSTFFG